MYKIVDAYDSSLSFLTLSDGDIETIKNALTVSAAECSHTAANAPTDVEREAFAQSAASFRALRTKLDTSI